MPIREDPELAPRLMAADRRDPGSIVGAIERTLTDVGLKADDSAFLAIVRG